MVQEDVAGVTLAQDVTAAINITDSTGAVIAHCSTSGGVGNLSCPLKPSQPLKLWSVTEPTLYTATVSLAVSGAQVCGQVCMQ